MEKRGFICMHKKWNNPNVTESCVDRPPKSNPNLCRYAKVRSRCKFLTRLQKYQCLKSCQKCTRRRMSKTNLADTSKCPKLKVTPKNARFNGDTTYVYKRKEQGQNCVTVNVLKQTSSRRIKGRSKTVLATWDRARDICSVITDSTRGVRGQLMSIDSDCKEKFILSRKIEVADDLDDGEDETDDDLEEKNTMIWIGLRFNQTNSRFEWQNGAKFEHDMWDLDQPLEDDYLGDKECVAVNRTTGMWSMQSCFTKYRFYCQHEKYIRHERESDLRVGVCDFSTKQFSGVFGGRTAGENKQWYHFRNKCYFPVGSKDFTQAVANCTSHHAQLLRVYNKEEHAAVLKRFEGPLYLGLYTLENNRQVWWGDPERAIPFRGQYDKSASNANDQKCTIINSNGTWKHVSCQTKYKAVCVRTASLAPLSADTNEKSNNDEGSTIESSSSTKASPSSHILGTLWVITSIALVAFTVFHYRSAVRRRLDQVGVLSGYYPASSSSPWLSSSTQYLGTDTNEN